MITRTFIAVCLAASAGAADIGLAPTDPRRDNPRFQQQAPEATADGYSITPAAPERLADPQGDAALERRARVHTLLEAVSTSGLEGLKTSEHEQLVAQLGSDLLLLPDEAGEPFRRLCVRALARLQTPGWWRRDDERLVISALIDVVAQAHVAGGKQFLDAFDNVGVFEPSAQATLTELLDAALQATTFANLDRIDVVARQAYAVLAAAGRAPTSTYQETPVYAALIRRRAALRP
jgi:hypothetical protein